MANAFEDALAELNAHMDHMHSKYGNAPASGGGGMPGMTGVAGAGGPPMPPMMPSAGGIPPMMPPSPAMSFLGGGGAMPQEAKPRPLSTAEMLVMMLDKTGRQKALEGLLGQ